MPPPRELYEHDFYAWTQAQASLLEARQCTDLDLLHLVEEVESLGKSQQHALDEAPESEAAALDEESLQDMAGGRNGTHQSQQGRAWGWW